MEIHPDSSPIIDPKTSALEFLKLFKNFESKTDHYNILKRDSHFLDVEFKFDVPSSAIIPTKIFEDPAIFSDLGKNKKSASSSSTNPPDSTSFEPLNLSDHHKNDYLPEISILNETLTSILPIGKKKQVFSKVLEESGLLSLKQSSMTSFKGLKREQPNAMRFMEFSNETGLHEPCDFKEGELIYEITIHPPGRVPIKKMQDFKVLGSQPLTVLRDAIYCQEDFVHFFDPAKESELEKKFTEFSLKTSPAVILPIERPIPSNTLAEKTSSSYFFFEGTFYVDKRSPSAIDYSEEVRLWAGDPTRPEEHLSPDLKTALMSATKLEDINLRVNQPYLFCHQGDCTHILIIHSIRLFHPKLDDHRSAKYPITVFQVPESRKKCQTCNVYFADHIAINDIHSGSATTFFCDRCHKLFHLNADGRPLYPLCIYPYLYEK